MSGWSRVRACAFRLGLGSGFKMRPFATLRSCLAKEAIACNKAALYNVYRDTPGGCIRWIKLHS